MRIQKVKKNKQGDEDESNLLKPGIHYCKIFKVDERTTWETKDPKWNVYYKDLYTEKEITMDRLVFSEKAMESVQIKLEMLGFPPDENDYFDVDSQELKGRTMILELVLHDYNGKKSIVPNFKSKKYPHGYWPVTEENLKLVVRAGDPPTKAKDQPEDPVQPEEPVQEPSASKSPAKPKKDDIPF